MANFERYVMVAGLTILAGFVGAMLMPLRFDSGLRGLKEGAVAATFLLELTWFAVAIIFALKQWRSTTSRFRVILVLNGLACVLIVAETLRELSAG